MGAMFPITSAAFTRLRRTWRIWWAGYHVFAAMSYLHALGEEGLEANEELKRSYIYSFPRALSPHGEGE